MSTSRNRLCAAFLVLGCLVTLAGWVPTASGSRTTMQAQQAERPNVVLILTDDMRRDDLRYMSYTRRLFARTGVRFTHALSPHPTCCPARAELFTGQYGQNNGVHHNTGETGGYQALQSKADLVFEWYQDAGYQTAFIGKFMNGYRGGDIPGLTVNDASVDRIYAPEDVVTWNNGEPITRPGHQTPMVADYTARLIRRFRAEPFFIWAGYIAPHASRGGGGWQPSVPPPGYDEWRSPKHAVIPYKKKPSYLRDRGLPRSVRRLKEPRPRYIRRTHRNRVWSLYAVDDAVRRTVRALRRAGEYDDTILVFTSDNGYSIGEHKIVGKNHPYQEEVRVPLMMAGPGLPVRREGSVVTLVDLPVTLARRTGVTAQRQVDGRNMFTRPGRRAVLIQAGSPHRPWEWRGVYTRRWTMAEHWTGELELFDRWKDPYEVRNRDDSAGHRRVRRRLLRLLHRQLADCAGETCQAVFR